MGIRIVRDFENEEDEDGFRKNKRVRISESNSQGATIYSPTSENASLSNASSSPYSFGNTQHPLRNDDLQRTTYLRRRNAIRRRYLLEAPRSDSTMRGPIRPRGGTLSFPQSRPYSRGLTSDQLDPVASENAPSDRAASFYQQPGHSNTSTRNFDAWRSTDNILAHAPSSSSFDPMAESSDAGEADNDSISSETLSTRGNAEDEIEAARRLLPIIPPLPEGYHIIPSIFRASPPNENVIDDDQHEEITNAYVTFGYTARNLRSPPSLGVSHPMSRSTMHPRLSRHEKTCLPHVGSLLVNEDQLLNPRNEDYLTQRAEDVSRERYGKVMASGAVGALDENEAGSVAVKRGTKRSSKRSCDDKK